MYNSGSLLCFLSRMCAYYVLQFIPVVLTVDGAKERIGSMGVLKSKAKTERDTMNGNSNGYSVYKL